MLWVRFSGLACLLLSTISKVCGGDIDVGASAAGDGPVKTMDGKSNKVSSILKRYLQVVFEAPNAPEDAILALYFSSPGDMEKMILSTATKEGVDAAISKYEGKWSIEVPATSAIENDYSLVLKSEGKHHAIAVDLGRDFKFDVDEFVVQYEVYVDQSLIKSGNLLSDFTPPVNPPTEINDPNDKKPETWDEREKIPDPNAKKPDDWDESAPQFITDEDATMPEGWLVDAPKLIPDPKAERPSDWNTETDGEWEAPMIDNPDCQSAPGCGPWEKPKKLNPNYKGKWSPPMIPNPKFAGIWKPKKIPNPDYFEDKQPYRMTPVRALGLELWSMTAEIAFDNFYIGTSKKGADKFAAETWVLKQKAEEQSRADGRSVFNAAAEMVSEKPLYVAAGVAISLLVLVLCFYCCCRSPAAKDDAYYKKTDEPVPDSNPEEFDAAVCEEDDAERSGSDVDKGEEEQEEDGVDPEEEQEMEEESPKPSSTRQRTRKE
ncbi:Calnexin [Taenia crassiceps]|uniref:Calnexin n=1 Tax=Taenia crassiceps TaxID=6207 RepID=A0ABR4QTN7_9CEST